MAALAGEEACVKCRFPEEIAPKRFDATFPLIGGKAKHVSGAFEGRSGLDNSCRMILFCCVLCNLQPTSLAAPLFRSFFVHECDVLRLVEVHTPYTRMGKPQQLHRAHFFRSPTQLTSRAAPCYRLAHTGRRRSGRS